MAFVLPLEVDGVAATLTHMKGESVVMLVCMQRPGCVCVRLPVRVMRAKTCNLSTALAVSETQCSMHAPARAPLLLPILLSHNIPFPSVDYFVMGRLVHTSAVASVHVCVHTVQARQCARVPPALSTITWGDSPPTGTCAGVEVQVDAGVVRLALTNYTGVLFLSQTAPDGPGDSAAVLSAVEEARGAKRRGRDCPPQTPDPADARTIKKPKGLKADDDEGAWNGVDDEAGSGRSDDLRLESLAHVYEQLDAAASSELIVHGGVEAERGVFALLGNGKNPGKTGAVTVSASGYDPGLKRPEDLTGGTRL
jgi:hypothetical protein